MLHTYTTMPLSPCSKNGKKLGHAFTVPEALRRAGLYPSCCVKNAELQFNFGASPFRFPPDVRVHGPCGLCGSRTCAGAVCGRGQPARRQYHRGLDQRRSVLEVHLWAFY